MISTSKISNGKSRAFFFKAFAEGVFSFFSSNATLSSVSSLAALLFALSDALLHPTVSDKAHVDKRVQKLIFLNELFFIKSPPFCNIYPYYNIFWI